ncbi:beta-ketoacyl synthase chain length factor [Arhodomonas sp. AD133]|uniref:beta-ketoacyl synthase chain length factor n=1 Tax=Arhodomonas sp. AD133 TaxID=3415009 RepID=UPI003EBCE846
MPPMTVHVAGVGVAMPGLEGWEAAAAALRGDRVWSPAAVQAPRASVLPRTEARRATGIVHLAVRAADEALPVAQAGDDELASVFASAEGDMATLEHICRSLAAPEPWVSPHRFHNSVHNAPAGYWSIAARCHGSSTSLSAGDTTAAAGLLEALGLVLADGHERCLLVVYDEAASPALTTVRANRVPFAAALLLCGDGDGPRLSVSQVDAAPSGCRVAAFDALRESSAAAGILPLLACLAAGGGRTVLPCQASGIAVEVTG